MKQLLDADAVAEAMDDLYGAMMAGIPAEAPLAMIGVHTRGDVIARRLAARLAEERDAPFDQGVLDITFYRDDLAQRERAPLVRTTTMNFDLDDKLVVLVDDVLHTGRSVRAAMDAIMDFGRPMAIRLAVLIDRVADPVWRLLLVTGFLGGYTTFSSYSFELVAMLTTGRLGWAAAYLVASNLLGVAGCLAGTVVGRGVLLRGV